MSKKRSSTLTTHRCCTTLIDQNNTKQNAEFVLIFGDSFVGPFTLIQHQFLKVYRFSGATLKGITKPDNKNRTFIVNELKKFNNQIKALIFVFGNVDLHLSFYYKVLQLNKAFSIRNSICEYVSFIKDLSVDCKKIVLNVYPSPIKSKNIINSLLLYRSITDYEINKYHNNIQWRAEIKPYFSAESRTKRYLEFKSHLKTQSGSNGIIFWDTAFVLENNVVKQEFLDISKYNIHLRWEPQMKHLTKALNDENLIEYEYDQELCSRTEQNYLVSKKHQLINNSQYQLSLTKRGINPLKPQQNCHEKHSVSSKCIWKTV
eukprot:442636_1